MGAGGVRVAVVDPRELVRVGLTGMLQDGANVLVVAAASAPEELRPEAHPLDVVVVGATSAGALHEQVPRIRLVGAVPVLVGGDRPSVLDGAMVLPWSVDAATLRRAVVRVAPGPGLRTAPLPAPTNAARLSRCEQEVLALYALGAKAQAVASAVGLSVDTVNTYVRRIRQKYERVGRPAVSRIDLYRRAVEDGLVGEQASGAAPRHRALPERWHSASATPAPGSEAGLARSASASTQPA